MKAPETPSPACRSRRTRPWSNPSPLLLATLVLVAIAGCGDEPTSLEELRVMQARGAFAATLDPLRERLETRPDDPELNYLYGAALLGTGSPDRAIWAMRKAAKDPRWAEAARLQLGNAALATREWANAIAIASEILAENPDSAPALLIRGNARLEEKSDYEAALADFERLTELEPANLEAQAARVAALIAVGRVDDAATALETLSTEADAKSAAPGVGARICTVAALFAAERGLDEDAEQRFVECLERHPRDGTLLDEYVSFLDDRRRSEEARALLFAAVEQSPDDSVLRIGLARRLIVNERFEESKALLDEGTQRPNPRVASDAWATLADHYVALHDPNAAADAYRKSLDLLPQPTIHQQLTLGDILARAERNEEALEVAAAIDNEVYRGLIEARVQINQGDAAGALASLDAVLPRWPNNPGARYWAARAAERLGRFDRAVEEYRQSIRSGAGFTDAGVRLARLRLAEGAFEDAWNALNRFVDERPNDPDAARILMQIATLVGPDARLRALTQRLSSRPSWPDAVAERARTLATPLGPERGLQTLRVAGLDLSRPVNVEALRARVDLLLELTRAEEALAAVDAGLARAPDAPRFLALRGRVLVAMGRGDEAMASSDRALELAPRDARVHTARGLVLLENDRLDDALAAFAEARRIAPGLVEAYTAPGRALAETPGRRDEARALWQALLDERPEHTGAALTLARARLAESQRAGAERAARLAEALALAERAERFGAAREGLSLQVEILTAQGAPQRAAARRAELEALPDAPALLPAAG